MARVSLATAASSTGETGDLLMAYPPELRPPFLTDGWLRVPCRPSRRVSKQLKPQRNSRGTGGSLCRFRSSEPSRPALPAPAVAAVCRSGGASASERQAWSKRCSRGMRAAAPPRQRLPRASRYRRYQDRCSAGGNEAVLAELSTSSRHCSDEIAGNFPVPLLSEHAIVALEGGEGLPDEESLGGAA